MPAAAVKGIIISISIIAALGVAVLENPQIQVWLEEQRKKIADLLRSIGEELDPASRRAAEAFAFEGRTPASNIELTREVSGSRHAAEVATGRSLENDTSAVTSLGTVRRIPVMGPSDPEQAEERRRKGREYLAKRNQQMLELRERRRASEKASPPTPLSPISFDEMVDEEGKLRLVDATEESSSTTSIDTTATVPKLTDPFGDENALEGSETPRAPSSPRLGGVSLQSQPGLEPVSAYAFERSDVVAQRPTEESVVRVPEDTSYEEQMAIALSLSEAEQHARQMLASSSSTEDADLAAAIKASLKEFKEGQVSRNAPEMLQHNLPMNWLEPTPFRGDLLQPLPQPIWDNTVHSRWSSSRESQRVAPSESDHEELYRVTPQLSTVPLAASAAVPISQSTASITTRNQDSASDQWTVPPFPIDNSSPPAELPGPLIDLTDETAPRSHTPTPTSHSVAVDTLSNSGSTSDMFASVSDIWAPAPSHPQSEESDIEVIDVVEDSDIDMMSEAPDRTMTPDSWTEVGSEDGESEDSEIWSHRQ